MGTGGVLILRYDFQVPPRKRVRSIAHPDCKKEADDQYTFAHILMTTELVVRGNCCGAG